MTPPKLIWRRKSLPTYRIKAAGTCKRGERSDLTGCTPATDQPQQQNQLGSHSSDPEKQRQQKQKQKSRRYQIGRRLAEECNNCTHILGRLQHTSAHSKQPGQSVLLMDKWTPAMNEGWMDVLIEQKRPVQFAQPIKKDDFYVQVADRKAGTMKGDLSILHHEVSRLLDAGYQPVKDQEGNLISMQPPGGQRNQQ